MEDLNQISPKAYGLAVTEEEDDDDDDDMLGIVSSCAIVTLSLRGGI